MNALGEKIAGLIRAAGPMSVGDYMAICLFDPDEGYYTTRNPFGVEGDFTTAPEISQMFGELVAIWLVQAWNDAGKPLPATFAEIGPGRGTLMKDMVRALRRIAPELVADADFALVEASPRLKEVQGETLRDAGVDFAWHETPASLLSRPLFIVGNEIFDALPFRQFVRKEGRWLERAIGLDDAGRLRFGVGVTSLSDDSGPENVDTPEGSIFEVAPQREALMGSLAAHIAGHGGAGLFFDYGHLVHGLGDTFQAVRKHASEDVLERPGETDLTSHVDFSALARVARAQGLRTDATTQGDFLLRMGLLERAGRLGSEADTKTREGISAAVERLAGPHQMGKLFKVLMISRA